MDILTSESVRRVRPDNSIVTLNKLEPSEWPIYTPPPQKTEPSTLAKINYWARRIFKPDGSYGSVGLPQTPRPTIGNMSGAVAVLRDTNAKLLELQRRIGDITGRIVVHHAAPNRLAAARANLKALQDADLDAAGKAAFDVKPDLDASTRAQGIDDAQAQVTKAIRECAIASTAIRAADAEAEPVNQAIASITARLPHLQRAALLELLADEAPLLEQTAARHYAMSVRVFGITKALGLLMPKTGGDSCGSGLESHLQMPTPAHPSYQFKTVPRLFHDVADEAQRIMEDLKA